MIKPSIVNNKGIKEIPVNIWLEGTLEDVLIREGRVSSYLAFAISWNGLSHFATVHPKYVNKHLLSMGLQPVPIREGMQFEEVKALLAPYIGHKFGFMLELEHWQGRYMRVLKQIISYTELGYQQNLNR